MTHLNSSGKVRILGIDPGSRVAGFAIVERANPSGLDPKDFHIIYAGALKASGQLSYWSRISGMHEALYEIAKEWQPTIGIIEKAFVGVNSNSAIKLGESRGSLICALSRLNIPIKEVAATQVKKTIAGSGRATKEEVCLALKVLTNFDRGQLPYDVTDAIAIALYYGLIHPYLNAYSQESKHGTTTPSGQHNNPSKQKEHLKVL